MIVRLDRGQDGSGLTFELTLCNGKENSNPTSIQIEDSSEQISLAESFGFVPSENADDDVEGIHGEAYDFLAQNIGKKFNDPGYFQNVP